MKNFRLIVGVDISKLKLDVSFRKVGESVSEHVVVENSATGIAQLFRKLKGICKQENQILICCEHTGVYMDKLWVAVQTTQMTFWPLHPMVIKSYQLDLDRLKNDKVDAGKILEFAFNHAHKATHYKHPGWQVQQLRDLYRLRKQLTKLQQQIKNFISAKNEQAYSTPFASIVYQQVLTCLSEYIKATSKEITQTIKSSERLNKMYLILVSIPGIGPVTAVHIIAITNAFSKINTYKQFACYIGIAPFGRSSGSSLRRRPKTSKKAYRALKAEMHQGVISTIRQGQLFHEYYNQMISLNKHHLWVVNSIKNIIAKLVFTLINKSQEFDKELFLKNKKSWCQNLEMS